MFFLHLTMQNSYEYFQHVLFFSLSVINLSISIICQARRAHLFQFFFYYVLDVDGGHSYFKFYKSYILFSLRPKLFFCVCHPNRLAPHSANIFFLVINRKILSPITSRKLISLMSSKLCVFLSLTFPLICFKMKIRI